MHRCHNCAWGEIPPDKNLQVRICRAVPPTPLALPHPQGVMIQMTWPQMTPNDYCGTWAPKGNGAIEVPALPTAEELAAVRALGNG